MEALDVVIRFAVDAAVDDRLGAALARVDEAWTKIAKIGVRLCRADEERRLLRDRHRELEAERAALERERRRCVHEHAALRSATGRS